VSNGNFLFVPYEDGRDLGERLLRQGLVVRAYDDGIRITLRDRVDDDLLVEALARLLDRPAPVAAQGGRRVRHLRATAETRIAVRLGLDGASRVSVQTGGGIYDHFLEQLAFHAGLDLVVEGSGDLETGDHHTVEDTALAFGEALDKALADRRGIARYGDATVPMDDALARAAVDLGGRPFAELSIDPEPGMAGHFFGSLAQAGRLAVHVEASGRDAHHTAEAAYKAVGRALKTALRVESSGIPSTKGKL
jgi:imidazoleglycerol phosphate dehydratase HisB